MLRGRGSEGEMQSATENEMSDLMAENATQKYPVIPWWEEEEEAAKCL